MDPTQTTPTPSILPNPREYLFSKPADLQGTTVGGTNRGESGCIFYNISYECISMTHSLPTHSILFFKAPPGHFFSSKVKNCASARHCHAIDPPPQGGTQSPPPPWDCQGASK